MAIHAAMVHRIDQEVGRLIHVLRDLGHYDNTVFVVLSDNGASAEQFIRGDGHIQEARICLSRDLEPVPCGRDVARDCKMTNARFTPVR